ncbi:diadenylate cyclase CdaA [Myxococcota bacterium]|nr:diadenylate cyclase CdaA [Myxococcota bacterium]
MDLVREFRVSDAIDIALVYYFVYRALLVLRGTRAFQMLIGLVAFIILYLLSETFDLHTIHWILDKFFVYLVLAVIIIFQNDIRRALARVGYPVFAAMTRQEEVQVFEEISRAAFRLAAQGKGALIAVERDASLVEVAREGTPIDGRVTAELLVSIFQTSSPIHDGAVVVRKARLAAAGCFLPLSSNPSLHRYLGTRHRAAIGLTEEADALVFLVSEEQRRVALVADGRVMPASSPDELRLLLQQVTSGRGREPAEADPRPDRSTGSVA